MKALRIAAGLARALLSISIAVAICAAVPFACGAAAGIVRRGYEIGAGR